MAALVGPLQELLREQRLGVGSGCGGGGSGASPRPGQRRPHQHGGGAAHRQPPAQQSSAGTAHGASRHPANRVTAGSELPPYPILQVLVQFAGVVLIREGSNSVTAHGDKVESEAATEQQQSEEGSARTANVAEAEGQE